MLSVLEDLSASSLSTDSKENQKPYFQITEFFSECLPSSYCPQDIVSSRNQKCRSGCSTADGSTVLSSSSKNEGMFVCLFLVLGIEVDIGCGASVTKSDYFYSIKGKERRVEMVSYRNNSFCKSQEMTVQLHRDSEAPFQVALIMTSLSLRQCYVFSFLLVYFSDSLLSKPNASCLSPILI